MVNDMENLIPLSVCTLMDQLGNLCIKKTLSPFLISAYFNEHFIHLTCLCAAAQANGVSPVLSTAFILAPVSRPKQITIEA